MSNTKGRRLLSLFLAALIMAGSMSVTVQADDPTDTAVLATAPGPEESDGTGMSLQNIKDILATVTYEQYLEQHKDDPLGKTEVQVDVSAYETDAESTTAEVEVVDATINGKTVKSLNVGDKGIVTFKANVPAAGMYSMSYMYRPTTGKTTSVERTLYINGKVPFKEARGLIMKKAWEPAYTEQEDGAMRFDKDLNGNEIRPRLNAKEEWLEYVLNDANGYYNDPLLVYLEAGENTVTFEAVREPFAIAELKFIPQETTPKYEDLLKEWESKGYKNAECEPIHIDAELPAFVSDYSIYPINDKTSAKTEPQSAKYTLLNTQELSEIGQWMEYDFTVEESGIYSIVLRYRQNTNEGTYSSQKILIDGKVPHDAAANVKFEYSDSWETDRISDGENELKFYLEKGDHTLRIATTLGDMAYVLRELSSIQSSVNTDYLEILRLTGASPDEYTDYGFFRVMPDTMKDLRDQSDRLYEIVDYMEEMNGKSDLLTTLESIADLLHDMGTDEDEVASNLEGLKSDLGTIGTYVLELSAQPLSIDYISIQSPDDKVPKADANFFQNLWHEILQFFYSFFIDYNALNSVEADVGDIEPVEVWTTAGRDKTQIIKNLVDSKFTPVTNIPINLKLVSGGTLLPAILAGIGPDVALEGMTSTGSTITTASGTIIDYAIRGAVLEVQDMPGFAEVASRFNPTSFNPVDLYGRIFGVPVSQSWNMMFYRTDVLNNLNIEIPKTWDDLLACIPVLQFNNMEVGLSASLSGFTTFMYQMGGEFWADDGMRINFDDNIALEAFEKLVNMFTQYSMPLSYDASNRFRTGELPLFVGDYLSYNSIVIFATELAGLWEFSPTPGTVQDDGSIDTTSIGASDAICMLRGCEDKLSAWEFMKWYTDTDYQVEYSNELVTLLGEAAKNNPANLAAIEQLSWTESEYEALMEQSENVICLYQYPGAYFVQRYVDFAISNAYSLGTDPVEELLGYVSTINKEISRKREEFGLETLEVGQTLADKRAGQAQEELKALSAADKETYKEQIKALDTALKLAGDAKIDALNVCIENFSKADEKLFGTAVGYLQEAVKALESYRHS